MSRSSADAVIHIQDVLHLSDTELGRLFGVTRQTITGWRRTHPPSSRQDKLATIDALLSLLEHHLDPVRLPGIVRTPATAYDGRSMLDLIAADRHDRLLVLTRQSFEFSGRS